MEKQSTIWSGDNNAQLDGVVAGCVNSQQMPHMQDESAKANDKQLVAEGGY
jgi:hypothetical protein